MTIYLQSYNDDDENSKDDKYDWHQNTKLLCKFFRVIYQSKQCQMAAAPQNHINPNIGTYYK